MVKFSERSVELNATTWGLVSVEIWDAVPEAWITSAAIALNEIKAVTK